jgi:hypothetical protein
MIDNYPLLHPEEFIKINEPFEMTLIKHYNVDKLIDYVNLISDEQWKEDLTRKNMPGGPHHDTYSYYITNTIFDWSPGKKYDGYTFKTKDQKLIDLMIPMFQDIEQNHDGKIGMCIFIKLPPNQEVDAHHDNGDYLGYSRRHHIALVTNEKTTFTVDKTTINMKPGDLWEINNNKLHYAINNGKTDRIHLLIDVVPNKLIG